MADLLGNDIGLNYKGLLNLFTTINTGLDATLRVVTDGEGDSSPLYLSTTAIGLGTTSIWDNINGRLGIGTLLPTAQLDVIASASTVGLYVKGAAGTDISRFYNSSNALAAYVDSSGNLFTSLCRVSLTNQHDIRGVGGSIVLRANGTDFLANNASYSEFKTDGGTNENKSWSIGKGSACVASSLMEIVSTTRGFLPPRMTTTQKNAIGSPAAGLMIYDTSIAKLCVYTTAWETITSL